MNISFTSDLGEQLARASYRIKEMADPPKSRDIDKVTDLRFADKIEEEVLNMFGLPKLKEYLDVLGIKEPLNVDEFIKEHEKDFIESSESAPSLPTRAFELKDCYDKLANAIDILQNSPNSPWVKVNAEDEGWICLAEKFLQEAVESLRTLKKSPFIE